MGACMGGASSHPRIWLVAVESAETKARAGQSGRYRSHPSRCTRNGPQLWLTGINFNWLMFTCAGSVAIQKTVSAMSAGCRAWAPP